MANASKIIENMLENAVTEAEKYIAGMQAKYAQLKNIDNKTSIICKRFLIDPKMEPMEREWQAEQLLSLQRTRAALVQEILGDMQ